MLPTVVEIELARTSTPAPDSPACESASTRPARTRWQALLAWLARRPLVVLAVLLAIWGLTDIRSRGRVDAQRPTVHRTDFTVYTEAGAAFFDGRDPYRVTNPRGWGYLYPPLFAILVAPLHALDAQWQVVVWFFISLGLLWGLYRESCRLLRLVMVDERSPVRLPELPRWIAVAAASP